MYINLNFSVKKFRLFTLVLQGAMRPYFYMKAIAAKVEHSRLHGSSERMNKRMAR